MIVSGIRRTHPREHSTLERITRGRDESARSRHKGQWLRTTETVDSAEMESWGRSARRRSESDAGGGPDEGGRVETLHQQFGIEDNHCDRSTDASAMKHRALGAVVPRRNRIVAPVLVQMVKDVGRLERELSQDRKKDDEGEPHACPRAALARGSSPDFAPVTHLVPMLNRR